MANFRLTPAALADVDRIGARFFEPWQYEQAEHCIRSMKLAFRQAAEQPMLNPMSGRRVPKLRVGRYEAHRFLFRIEADGIAILRVYHHRQDMRGTR